MSIEWTIILTDLPSRHHHFRQRPRWVLPVLLLFFSDAILIRKFVFDAVVVQVFILVVPSLLINTTSTFMFHLTRTGLNQISVSRCTPCTVGPPHSLKCNNVASFDLQLHIPILWLLCFSVKSIGGHHPILTESTPRQGRERSINKTHHHFGVFDASYSINILKSQNKATANSVSNTNNFLIAVHSSSNVVPLLLFLRLTWWQCF